MRQYLLLFSITVLFYSCGERAMPNLGSADNDAPTISVENIRISDVKFPDQQYAINFLLHIDYKDTDTIIPKIDFTNALFISDTKRKPEITMAWLTKDPEYHEQNLVLNINCLMSKSFNVSGYPFDDQELSIDMYVSGFDTSYLNFHTDPHKITFPQNTEFDNSWVINTARASKKIYYQVMGETNNKVSSVFNFIIPIHRENPFFIFWKLFTGMYIAFLVSFVALFVSIGHEDPRFGLPVGGLFAAVANKYIIEGSLPLTSQLTLVDWLHDITIFFIFLIIAFSVISLRLTDQAKAAENGNTGMPAGDPKTSRGWKQAFMRRISVINPLNFLAIYFLINLIMILFAMF